MRIIGASDVEDVVARWAKTELGLIDRSTGMVARGLKGKRLLCMDRSSGEVGVVNGDISMHG